MENRALLIASLKAEMHIELPEKNSFEEIKEKLSALINHLINNDFQKLVMLLYRVDVNERKLRSVLSESKNEDAGNMIAQLIIERQLQKIKTRKEFSANKNEDSDEEKW